MEPQFVFDRCAQPISHCRRYDLHPLTRQLGGCQDLTESWHVGETGAQGSIKIKRDNRTRSTGWEVRLDWDSPLQRLQVGYQDE